MRVTLRYIDSEKDKLIFLCCCKAEKEEDQPLSEEEDPCGENAPTVHDLEKIKDDEEEEDDDDSASINSLTLGFIDDDEEEEEERILLPEMKQKLKKVKYELIVCPGPKIEYTFYKEDNFKFLTQMTCPLFEWECEISLKSNSSERYIIDSVVEVKTWNKKKTFTYSNLLRIGRSKMKKKILIEGLASHISELNISKLDPISSTDVGRMKKGYHKLFNLANQSVDDVFGFLNTSYYFETHYDMYVKNKDLLEILYSNPCVSKEDTMSFWNLIKEYNFVPTAFFLEKNPTIASAYHLLVELTKNHFAKKVVREKSDAKWSKEVLEIFKEDDETFNIKEVRGIKELSLSKKDSMITDLVRILKNTNLVIDVNRVEDDYSTVYHDDLIKNCEKKRSYLLVKDKDRAYYLENVMNLSNSQIISHSKSKVSKDCEVLIVDKAHLFSLKEVHDFLQPLENLKELRLYGSIFTPYYQDKGISIINTFGFLQKQGCQLFNVVYTSLASSISIEDREEVKFIPEISNVKKEIAKNPNKKFMFFHHLAEQKIIFTRNNVQHASYFTWYSGRQSERDGFWKAVLNLKDMTIPQFAHLINECKTDFIVMCNLEFFNSSNKFLMNEAPKYDYFVNCLK